MLEHFSLILKFRKTLFRVFSLSLNFINFTSLSNLSTSHLYLHLFLFSYNYKVAQMDTCSVSFLKENRFSYLQKYQQLFDYQHKH